MHELILLLTKVATDPLSFFQFFGYWGLALIIFAETGLFGFFLPGDSLLITLGLIAADDQIDVHTLVPILAVATILGDNFSYFLGRKFSNWVKNNIEKVFLEEEHLITAQNFYVRHGGKTIMFCKFVAFVRTFAPFVAGTSKMNYAKFLIFDVIGAIIWVAGLVYASYYLGQSFHFNLKTYFHYFFFFLGFIILSPLIFKLFKKKS
jgi:membrane-associated protein